MRLSRFVQKAAPKLGQTAMYKAIRTKHIKLNKKRCDAADRLKEGDVLDIWLDDSVFEKVTKTPDFMKASSNLEILYEDENIAVLHKPVGLNSHPVKGDYSDNLISRYLRKLYERGEYSPDNAVFTPALCNRLDRNTEGLVIAGKTRTATEAACAMIKRSQILKTYYAVAIGKTPSDGIYDAFLKKGEKKNTAFVRDTEKDGYRAIKTEFKTVAKKGELTLLEVTLHTGRPHQIRAHLAHLGSPILGDPKYGNAKANQKYCANKQYLCAYSLLFGNDDTGVLDYLEGKQITLNTLPFRDIFD